MGNSGMSKARVKQDPEINPGHCSMVSEDLWLKIFELLDHQALSNCALVCKHWRKISQVDSLWANLYKTDWSTPQHMSEARSAGNICGNPSRKLYASRGLLIPAATFEDRMKPYPQSGWKSAYRYRAETEQNWEKGDYEEFHLYGHRDYIRNVELHGNMLVTSAGSYARRDCSMRVWDIDRGHCLHRLCGHAGPVWSMVADGKKYVASASEDGIVRLWDLQAQKCAVLRGHVSDVHCVSLDMEGGQLVSGGKDEVVHLWSLKDIADALEDPPQEVEFLAEPLPARSGESVGDAQCAPEFAWRDYDVTALVPVEASHMHGDDIRCIQVERGVCLSGDTHRQGVVNVWSTTNNKLIHRDFLGEHSLGVNCMVANVEAQLCVVGDGMGKVHMWDLSRSARISAVHCHGLQGSEEAVTCIQYTPKVIGTASVDKTVCMISVDQMEVVNRFNLPDMPLSMQFDDTKLVCGCQDNRVYVYDLRMNKLLHILEGHSDKVWAIVFDEFQLVSAGLDGQIIVRNFMPAALRFQHWHKLELAQGLQLGD